MTRTATFVFRIDPELKRVAGEVAAEEKRTLANLLIWLMEQYLQERGRLPKA